MAALAIGPELAAMNVGVAIGASGADVLEIQIGVALGASHLGMHAPQRVAGLVVIELRVGADGFPARVGVALLAGNRNGAVRIGDFGLRAADTGPRVLRRLLRRRIRK